MEGKLTRRSLKVEEELSVADGSKSVLGVIVLKVEEEPSVADRSKSDADAVVGKSSTPCSGILRRVVGLAKWGHDNSVDGVQLFVKPKVVLDARFDLEQRTVPFRFSQSIKGVTN